MKHVKIREMNTAGTITTKLALDSKSVEDICSVWLDGGYNRTDMMEAVCLSV